MTLRVVIPTVDGREANLERCTDAYRETLAHAGVVDYVLDVRRGYATCGEAWNHGAACADEGDVLHLSADDLVPLEGWYGAACAALDRGVLPSPVVWREDEPGGLRAIESSGAWASLLPDWTPTDVSVIPTLPVGEWVRIPPIHYFSDNAVTSMCAAQGRTSATRHGYEFLHTWAEPGRMAMEGEQWDRERAAWLTYHATLPDRIARYHHEHG